VARCDAGSHPRPYGLGCHDFEEPGLRVVGLVAVYVYRFVVFLGEAEALLHGIDAHLAGVFVVGYAPDDVGAERECLLHQLDAPWEREHPLLREGDDLDVHPVTHLLLDLEQGSEASELGVRHVGVGAYVQDSLGRLPAEELCRAGYDVVVGQALFALGPDPDPLEERPRLVPPGLPGGQRRIQVHVGLDKRRRDETALGLYLAFGPPFDTRAYPSDAAILDSDVHDLVSEPRPAQDQLVHARPPKLTPPLLPADYFSPQGESIDVRCLSWWDRI
jgi:hypothetical protein